VVKLALGETNSWSFEPLEVARQRNREALSSWGQQAASRLDSLAERRAYSRLNDEGWGDKLRDSMRKAEQAREKRRREQERMRRMQQRLAQQRAETAKRAIEKRQKEMQKEQKRTFSDVAGDIRERREARKEREAGFRTTRDIMGADFGVLKRSRGEAQAAARQAGGPLLELFGLKKREPEEPERRTRGGMFGSREERLASVIKKEGRESQGRGFLGDVGESVGRAFKPYDAYTKNFVRPFGETVLDVGETVGKEAFKGITKPLQPLEGLVETGRELASGNLRGALGEVGEGFRESFGPPDLPDTEGVQTAITRPKMFWEKQREEYESRPGWQQLAGDIAFDPTTYVGSGALGGLAKTGRVGRALAGADRALDIAQGGPLIGKAFGAGARAAGAGGRLAGGLADKFGTALKPVRGELAGGTAGAGIGYATDGEEGALYGGLGGAIGASALKAGTGRKPFFRAGLGIEDISKGAPDQVDLFGETRAFPVEQVAEEAPVQPGVKQIALGERNFMDEPGFQAPDTTIRTEPGGTTPTVEPGVRVALSDGREGVVLNKVLDNPHPPDWPDSWSVRFDDGSTGIFNEYSFAEVLSPPKATPAVAEPERLNAPIIGDLNPENAVTPVTPSLEPSRPTGELGPIEEIDISLIDTAPQWFQARRTLPGQSYNEENVKKLINPERSDAIQKIGIREPLVIVPNPDKPGRFIVTAGHSRLEGAKRTNMGTVPARVHDIDIATPDDLVTARRVAALSNYQTGRTDLSEDISALKSLLDTGMSMEQAVADLAWKRSRAEDALNVAELGDAIVDEVVQNPQLAEIAAEVGSAMRKHGIPRNDGIGLFRKYTSDPRRLPSRTSMRQTIDRFIPRLKERQGIAIDGEQPSMFSTEEISGGSMGGILEVMAEHTRALDDVRKADRQARQTVKQVETLRAQGKPVSDELLTAVREDADIARSRLQELEEDMGEIAAGRTPVKPVIESAELIEETPILRGSTAAPTGSVRQGALDVGGEAGEQTFGQPKTMGLSVARGGKGPNDPHGLIGSKVTAGDRNNIGTVLGYDPASGKYRVHFRNQAAGTRATKMMDPNTITRRSGPRPPTQRAPITPSSVTTKPGGTAPAGQMGTGQAGPPPEPLLNAPADPKAGLIEEARKWGDKIPGIAGVQELFGRTGAFLGPGVKASKVTKFLNVWRDNTRRVARSQAAFARGEVEAAIKDTFGVRVIEKSIPHPNNPDKMKTVKVAVTNVVENDPGNVTDGLAIFGDIAEAPKNYKLNDAQKAALAKVKEIIERVDQNARFYDSVDHEYVLLNDPDGFYFPRYVLDSDGNVAQGLSNIGTTKPYQKTRYYEAMKDAMQANPDLVYDTPWGAVEAYYNGALKHSMDVWITRALAPFEGPNLGPTKPGEAIPGHIAFRNRRYALKDMEQGVRPDGSQFDESDAAFRQRQRRMGAELRAATEPKQRTFGPLHTITDPLRYLGASLDVSAIGLQGLATIATTPTGAGRAYYHGTLKSLFKKTQNYYEDIAVFSRKSGLTMYEKHRYGLFHGLISGQDDLGYTGVLQKVKGLEASARVYTRTRNYLANEQFEHLYGKASKNGKKQLSEEQIQQIANAANRAVGVPKSYSTDLEQVAFFAPGFLRSQVESARHLIKGTAIEKAAAREQARNLLVAGAAATFAINYAQGRDTEVNPFAPGFMRIHWGEKKWSLFGPADSFFRFVLGGTMATAQMIAEQGGLDLKAALPEGQVNIGPIKATGRWNMPDSPLEALRSKIAPGLALAYDLALGENFLGKPITPESLILERLPFSLSDTLEAVSGEQSLRIPRSEEDLERWADGLTDLLLNPSDALGLLARTHGVKVSEYTTNDRQEEIRDRLIREGKVEEDERYAAATDSQVRLAAPELEEERVENITDEPVARYEQETIKMREDQASEDDQLLAGELSLREYRDGITERLLAHRSQAAIAYGDEGGSSGSAEMDEYIDMIETLVDEFGDPDWEAIEGARQAKGVEWNSNVDKQAAQWLDSAVAPAIRYGLRDKLSEYYDLPKYAGFSADEANQIDEAWLRFKKFQKDEGSGVGAYRALEQEGRFDDRVLFAVRKRMQGEGLKKDKAREWYKHDNPEIELAIGTGLLTDELAGMLDDLMAELE
jgi:hypothetical protein